MVSFWYLPNGATPEYRKIVSEFLNEIMPSARDIMAPSTYVGPHESLNPYENPKGLVASLYFVDLLEQDPDQLVPFCEYIFSRDLKIKPRFVSSNQKKDYAEIERVLKEVYGEKAKLAFSLFARPSSERRIVIPRTA